MPAPTDWLACRSRLAIAPDQPLGRRSSDGGGASSLGKFGSIGSSLLTLVLRSRELDENVRLCDEVGDTGGEASEFFTGFTNLKIWTVSEADETQSSVDVALKDM